MFPIMIPPKKHKISILIPDSIGIAGKKNMKPRYYERKKIALLSVVKGIFDN